MVCAHNAISFTDYDRCGEPIQRCQCLAGFVGDGYKECQGISEKIYIFPESGSGKHFHASAMRAIDFSHDFTPKNDLFRKNLFLGLVHK